MEEKILELPNKIIKTYKKFRKNNFMASVISEVGLIFGDYSLYEESKLDLDKLKALDQFKDYLNMVKDGIDVVENKRLDFNPKTLEGYLIVNETSIISVNKDLNFIKKIVYNLSEFIDGIKNNDPNINKEKLWDYHEVLLSYSKVLSRNHYHPEASHKLSDDDFE